MALDGLASNAKNVNFVLFLINTTSTSIFIDLKIQKEKVSELLGKGYVNRFRITWLNSHGLSDHRA